MSNICMEANPDLVFTLHSDPAFMKREFKQNSTAIDEVFNQLSQYIGNASAEELTRLITLWGMDESESAPELMTNFWIAKWIQVTLNDSIDSFFNKVSNWQLRILLKTSVEKILMETIPCDLEQFSKNRMAKVKEQLQGALMNSKTNHLQLLRQEYLQ